MVNGPNNIFFERHGKVKKSEVSFVNEEQLLAIAKRIASRVDDVSMSFPYGRCKARRWQPCEHCDPTDCIRRYPQSPFGFREQKLFRFEDLIGFGSMSPDMARVLMIASRCRINVLISGGTGSGKTTLPTRSSIHCRR
ncbi:ATPase, T2SS/T4P/T4SS family [Vibrio chagasii]|nr:ATPase, T2SS/T4P/T4SS family [Vibrio chagasii]